MLVKLQTNASVKSTQLLMLRGFRLFSHVRAMPWSMSGTNFTSTRFVAVCYVVGRGVVNQPVLRLHGAGVLGRVSWEGEPFGKGLISNAGPETRRTQLVFFFQRQGSVKSVDPVAGVVFPDSLAVAKAVAESRMINRR